MRGSYKTKTKGKILNAAWNLFQEKGYHETTIVDIIEKSGTSRSTFYHHFHGKEELLFSIAYTYDEDYDSWLENTYDSNESAISNLISFNTFVLHTVETVPFRQFYPELYGLQVMTDGIRPILNSDRRYYKIFQKLIREGIEAGEISSSQSYATLTDMIISTQIGLTYAWSLQRERFSLVDYGESIINSFILSLKAN